MGSHPTAWGYLGKTEWLERWFRIKPETVYRYKERVERWGAWLALLTWVPFIGDVFAVVLGFFKARFWPSAWWMLVGVRPLRGMGHNILLDRTAFQMTMTDIQRDLFAMQDEAYRDFHSKLVPALDKQRIIGVRTPILRRYARQLASRDDCAAFLADPPHRYYEENNIHAWIIASSSRDIDTVLPLVDGFLPRIDNWATCDLFAPKIFSKHRHRVIEYIPRWLVVPHLYGAFRHSHAAAIFLDEGFDPQHLDWVADIDRDDYYIRIAAAWYFSIALVKQWDATLPLHPRAAAPGVDTPQNDTEGRRELPHRRRTQNAAQKPEIV